MPNPGRAYQLLHSDAASAELEALGLDSSIFGAAGLPAPVFQALVPRRAGVFDENANTFGTADEPAAFTRASDGIYLDADGKYKIAPAGQIRAEYSSAGVFLGYLFEPAITNKCTNYNVQPDAALTNVTKAGTNASAVLSRAAATLPASISDLGNGQVIQIDNSAGTGSSTINIGGTVGNLNDHTLSSWIRVISGTPTNTKLRTNDGSIATANITASDWTHYTVSGTPGGTGNFLQLFCGASDRVIVQIIATQLEESPVKTSLIITQGATASRALDSPISFAQNASINKSAGMCLAEICWPFSASAVPATQRNGILTLQNASIYSILSANYNNGGSSGVQFLLNHSGTSADLNVSSANALDRYRVLSYWESGGSCRVLARKNEGAWQMGVARTFGSLTDQGVIKIGLNVTLPVYLKRLAVWSVVLSDTEIARLF